MFYVGCIAIDQSPYRPVAQFPTRRSYSPRLHKLTRQLHAPIGLLLQLVPQIIPEYWGWSTLIPPRYRRTPTAALPNPCCRAHRRGFAPPPSRSLTMWLDSFRGQNPELISFSSYRRRSTSGILELLALQSVHLVPLRQVAMSLPKIRQFP